jgi:hypothetical protein
MKKLTLALEALSVESFQTVPGAGRGAGTVQAHDKTLAWDTCGCSAAYDTPCCSAAYDTPCCTAADPTCDPSCNPCDTCDTSCAGGPYCDCLPSGCPQCG